MKKIYILLILVLFVSCKDFLTVEPVEQISVNNQLSTKNGVLIALNGVYYQTRQNILSEAFFTYGDLLAGNLSFSPNTSNGVIAAAPFTEMIYNFSDDKNSSQLESFYKTSYENINNINLILEYVDDLKDATLEEKNQIKAEALALRAFTHFNLYKIYAQNYNYTSDASHLGIVYNTRSLKVAVDYPARETAKRTFELLTDDINKAISLYNAEHAIPAGATYNFLNLNAAKCLAADIALWKNDWETAIKWASDVISTSGKTLSTAADFPSNWAQSEKIWDFGKTANTNLLNQLYMYTSGTNYSEYTVSKDYQNLLTTGDKRNMLITNNTIRNKSYIFPVKFQNISGIIYRLSEMYFIRAEAQFKKNNLMAALQDINTIRSRAGVPSLSQITLPEIITEKRREFLCENKTFFDLARNQINIERTDCIATTYCNLSYPNFRFVAPIPQSSIEINSNMQQNPGY